MRVGAAGEGGAGDSLACAEKGAVDEARRRRDSKARARLFAAWLNVKAAGGASLAPARFRPGV